MKNNILKNILILTLISFIGLQGCEKMELNLNENDNLLIPENFTTENVNNLSGNIIDQQRELLCTITAKSMKNQEFRLFIKEEALKQFDGDYDVLFQNVKDKNIAKGKSIEDFLYDYYLNEKGVNTSKSEFNKIIESIPDFQISVPVNCEKWKAETEIPFVTYIPVDFDEQKTEFVTAFDYNGNTHYLSTEVEPDVPVVVLGTCERNVEEENIVIENPNTKLSKNIKSYSFKFPNLSRIETWVQGGPEIRIGMKSNDGGVDVEKVYYFDRDDVKNGVWFNRTETFFTWYYVEQESTGFGITEMDNGGNVTFSFSFKFLGINFSLAYAGKDNDDNLGKDQTYSDSPNYSIIDCGDTFKMKIKY